MSNRNFLVLLVLLPFAVASTSASTEAPAAAPGLFEALSSPASAKAAAPRFTKGRTRIAFTAAPAAHEALTLALPGGTVTAVRTRMVRHGAAHFEWIGRLSGDARSSVHFVSHEGTMVGRVESGEEVFEIRRLAGGTYVLDQADLPALRAAVDRSRDDGVPPRPGLPKPSAFSQAPAIAAPTVVDIMIVHDQAVQDKRPDIVAYAHSLVSQANEAFVRSQIELTLRLVRVEKVETGVTKPTAGGLDTVAGDARIASLRNKYGADLVALLVRDSDLWGIADINGAYSLSAVDFAHVDWTLTHELGHNFGALHNRENAYKNGGTPPPGTYNYGYRDFGRRFLTMMAYGDGCTGCKWINNFSNPSVWYDGGVTGVVEFADNARKIRETMASVAAWQKDSYRLSVQRTGMGKVRSDIAAIDCGADCEQIFPKPDVRTVTLTAVPEAGWSFKQWSGACQGAGACTVALDNDKQVSAVFQPAENFLSLALLDLARNREVASLGATTVLRIDTLPKSFTVQAKPMGAVGSVKFELAGPQFQSLVVKAAPYTLFGAASGVSLPWPATAGRYNLNVSAHATADGSGEALTVKRVVVDLKPPLPTGVEPMSAPMAHFRILPRGFAFRLHREADLRISARGIDGRETRLGGGLFQAGSHAVELPASLGAGLYTLRITGAGKTLLRTLIHAD